MPSSQDNQSPYKGQLCGIHKEYNPTCATCVWGTGTQSTQQDSELPEAIKAMNFTANCPDCNGIGSDENAGFWCSRCKGEGWVFLTQEWERLPETLPNKKTSGDTTVPMSDKELQNGQ